VKVIGKLGQNGSCAAVIVPRGHLRTLGWQRDEPLTIQVERGMLIVSSIREAVERNKARSAEAVAELERAGVL
jgi:antitoxin component of MazEF toxin-antitoxin module